MPGRRQRLRQEKLANPSDGGPPSHRLFTRLAKFFVLIAAVQILGGHWAVLQTVAWTKMVVDFAQQDSLSVAVAKTFDGAHPCELCQTVKEGRKEERKKQEPTAIAKLDAVLAPVVRLPPRPSAPRIFFVVTSTMCGVSQSPLTPPPRLS